jgi:hypothetical protein
MRSLGIALCVAWLSVGFDLLWLPPSQLKAEISVSKDFIESMQTSPLKDTPEMKQWIEHSKRLLTNPSRRAIVIWVAWTALLFIVVYGLWTAYAIFRNRSSAFGYVLIGCFIFLGRQAILNAGYYEIAFSIIWHHYVLGIFFFSLATLSLLRLFRKMRRGQTFMS